MESILTLTMNPAIDTSTIVDNVVPERKLRCTPPVREPGGGGINVSRAIQTLGGTSVALYPAGGPPGQILCNLLDEEKLDHRAIEIGGWTRENLTVYEEATEQQFRFGMPGPTLSEAEWNRCLDALSGFEPLPAYIVASGSLPPGVPRDFYARVAAIARDRDARVIVDASGEALALAVREGVFLIKPNLREFADLAERDVQSEEEQEHVAKELVSRGQSEVVVVSLGAAGALLVSKDGIERLRAPTVPIESKVGAGDSMVSGIVLGLAQGEPLREAVDFGVAAGAAAVMTPGTELCRREDTEKLYERMRLEART